MATLPQIQRELRENIGTVVGRIGSELVRSLSAQTRVDTGYHSSRWVGRSGGPPASRPTPKTRNGRLASLSFAQQSASIAALRNFDMSQRVLFVSNDGDFIEQLNAADGNFVPRTIVDVVRRVSLAGTTLTP